MIALQRVSKSYRDKQGSTAAAVVDLDLTVARGETLCLCGTSGCGKTTTLKLMNRLEEADSGSVLIDGQDARQADLVHLRRRMGYVIQSAGLFPHLTVADNTALLCRLEGWEQARIAERVRKLLELVNLDPDTHANRHPGALSGGQRQRVGVARALALDPPILLMDEPFSAVDPITRAQLHEEFLRLRDGFDKTIVIVTHDLYEAFKLADRVAIMDRGRLLQLGTAGDLKQHPTDPFVTEFLAAQGHA